MAESGVNQCRVETRAFTAEVAERGINSGAGADGQQKTSFIFVFDQSKSGDPDFSLKCTDSRPRRFELRPRVLACL